MWDPRGILVGELGMPMTLSVDADSADACRHSMRFRMVFA